MAQIQMQTHQGYIQADGRLDLIDKLVQLPKNIKVTVSWEEVAEVKPLQDGLTSEQDAAILFVEGIRKINEKGFSEDTLEAFRKWDAGEFKVNLEEREL